ncbi:hypothetical protein ACXNSR_13810 [Streptomyces sp. NC-S4]
MASLAIALLLAALSALVLLPAAQHLRSLRDGEPARATLRSGGSCVLGRCRIEFEAGGRTVVTNLPTGSSGGKNPAGTQLTVRYRAEDPRIVATEGDLGGGSPAMLAVLSGAVALFFLLLPLFAARYWRWATESPG